MTLRWSGGGLRLPTFPTCKFANLASQSQLGLVCYTRVESYSTTAN